MAISLKMRVICRQRVDELFLRMLKKASFLTRPTLAATSPSRSASAKTAAYPVTRLAPCKAVANYPFLRGGWDDPNCAQYSTHPALSAPRRALSRARAFSFPITPSRGVAKAAQLRASNEHSFTVRVLRARRAPGRSFPILLRPRVARARGLFQPPHSPFSILIIPHDIP